MGNFGQPKPFDAALAAGGAAMGESVIQELPAQGAPVECHQRGCGVRGQIFNAEPPEKWLELHAETGGGWARSRYTRYYYCPAHAALVVDLLGLEEDPED